MAFKARKVIAATLFCGLSIVLIGCREAVMHNLSETDANRLLTTLHSIEIDSKKVRQPDGKWLVEVPKTQALQAIRHLEQSRLFRDIRPQQPGKSSMITSREEQRAESVRVLSREIETTLTSIDGVLEARVHLQLPARDPFFGEKILGGGEGSASVLLAAGKDFSLTRDEIQALVSGAAGIKAERIAVVLTHPLVGERKNAEPAGLAPLGKLRILPGDSKRKGAVRESARYGALGELFRKAKTVPVQLILSVMILGAGFVSWWGSWRRGRLRCIRSLAGTGHIESKPGEHSHAL